MTTAALVLPRTIYLTLLARDTARWEYRLCGDLVADRARDVNTASLLIEGQPYGQADRPVADGGIVAWRPLSGPGQGICAVGVQP